MSLRRHLFAAGVVMLTASRSLAQGPSAAHTAIGNYQGTVATTPSVQRLVVRVFEGPDHRLSAYLVKLDEGGIDDRQIADTVQVRRDGIRLVFTGPARYEALASADGATITGTYTQAATVLPFALSRSTPSTEFRDAKAPPVTFVTVAPGVQLEVLDWGGTGRTIVLLAGLGAGGHVFNDFAPKLAAHYRVIGISRRGYGASSIPSTGYRTDSLADDVLAVLDSLKIAKPVLAGWSFGGAEMSSIASRAPERVSGLVYLDAGYPYAYYDATPGDANNGFITSASDVRRELEALTDPFAPIPPAEQLRRYRALLDRGLPDLERDIRAALPLLTSAPTPTGPIPTYEAVPRAIYLGGQKHTRIPVPTLAIFAYPHRAPSGADSATRAMIAGADRATLQQALAFERGVPSAKVIRIANAEHAVFESHPAEVMREIQAFVDGLPKR